MIKGGKKIGEILIEKKLITDEQLQNALQEQARTKEFLGDILLKKRYIQEEDLLLVLSQQFNLRVVVLINRYIDWGVVKSFSSSLVFDYKCVPLEKDDFEVTMAITNPLDSKVMSKAQEESRGLKVKFVLTSNKDIEDIITRYKTHFKGSVNRLFEEQ